MAAPVRLGSGDMGAAFDTALDHGADDFLTPDEVTIDQIHSLSTANPLKGLEQFASSSLPPLDTDLPLELPTDWRSSPASASRDSTSPGTYVSYESPVRATSAATSGSRGSASASGRGSTRDLADSATSPKPKAGLPRVAMLSKPAPKKEEPPAKPGMRGSSFSSRPSGESTTGPRAGSAVARTATSPGAGTPAAKVPRTSSTTSRIPSSPGSGPGVASRPGSATSRIPSSPALTRPTSPPGPAAGNSSRVPSSPGLARSPVPPSRTNSVTSRDTLSPGASRAGSYTSGTATRLAPRSSSVTSSPSPGTTATAASHPSPTAARSSPALGVAAARTSYAKGPSGKYTGAASKAPARKALEDIMSELQEVKQQLGLPSSSRRPTSSAEAEPGPKAAAKPAPKPEPAPAPAAAPAPEPAAPIVALSLPVEPAAAAPMPAAPVEEARIVFNISISEPESASAAKVAADHDGAAGEAKPATKGAAAADDDVAMADAAAAEPGKEAAAAEVDAPMAAAGAEPGKEAGAEQGDISMADAAAEAGEAQQVVDATLESARNEEAPTDQNKVGGEGAAAAFPAEVELAAVQPDESTEKEREEHPAEFACEKEDVQASEVTVTADAKGAPAAEAEAEKIAPTVAAEVPATKEEFAGNKCGCGCVVM